MTRPSLALAVLLPLAGCGGRAANVIPTTQSFDGAMSCAQLVSEFEANRNSVGRLTQEIQGLDGQNAGVVVGAILFSGLPMLTQLDDGSAANREIAGYKSRNRKLGELAVAKDCGNADLAAAATAPVTAPLEATATDSEATALRTQPSSTSSAGTTTSGVDPAEQIALQAEFDAWLAANRAVLLESVKTYVRENDLREVTVAGGSVEALQTTRVVRRDGDDWVVDVTYYLYRASPSAAYQSRNHTDRFRLDLEGGQLAGIDLAS